MKSAKVWCAILAVSAALGVRADVLEVGPGKTYSDIATAIGAANDHDTVLVYDGTYEIAAQIEITKPITLKSVNGAAVTTVRRIGVDPNLVNAAQRVLYVNNAGATVKGFTIAGGQVYNKTQAVTDANYGYAYGAGVFIDSEGGTLDSCVLRENRACYWANGGGVAALGAFAVVTNCTSCENSALYGSSGTGTPKGLGVYLKNGATLVDSLVSSNNSTSTTYCDAAGVYASAGTVRRTRICYNRSRFSRVGFISTGASVFEDVLVDRNLSQDDTNGGYGAGGVDGGVTTFLRCTFADNCSPKTGGGLNLGSTKSVFTDCILQDNGCLDDLTSNWTGTAAVFSNCLSNSTFPESAVGCRTGRAVFADDWAGDYRVAADSPGYEIGARACAYGADACAILDLSETAVPGSTLSFSGVVHCAGEAEVLCRWSADGGATWTDYGPSAAFALSVAEVGEKTIAFQAKVGGVERSVVTKTVRVAPEGIEVSTVEELVQAVKDARGGTTITVADGTYQLSEELVLDEAVLLVSANGAAATTLKRLTSTKEWTTQRCLVLNHPKARVEGFTITGGLAQWSYAPGWKEQRGSGVLIAERGGTLASCVVKDNKSIYWVRGAVAAYGPDAVVTNCDIVLNKATYGNGIGRVFGCGVAACQGARITHSRIDDNNSSSTAYLYGGGVFLRNAALSHCRIKGNKSSWPAGGLYATGDSTVGNCLFARNISNDKGGGAYVEGASAFVNCTFWGNSASAGGGVRIVSGTPTFLNCLFAQNGVSGTVADGDPDWSGSASATTFANCLVSVKVPAGSTGCQVGDAKLEDPENGDFTPKDVSLAVDNGCEETPDVPAFDYAGAKRVSGRRIDIGCCEFQMPEYTLTCEVSGEDVIVGSELTLTAFVRTALEGTICCRWSFDDGQTWTAWSDVLSTTHVFTVPGDAGYQVQVRVGETEMTPVGQTTVIGPADLYLVTPERATGTPTAPYDAPEKAATSFADAMAYARSGTVIHVGPGTHETPEEIVLSGRMKIVSDEGATATTVKRVRKASLADGEAARVISMNHGEALVKGLTITGGGIRFINGSSGSEKYAGGVLIGKAGGTLADCIVTGNTAYGNSFGAGLVALGPAVVTNCSLSANFGAYEGGGPTPTGGGAYLEGGATLVDCEISDNEATSSGDYQRCHGAGVAVGQFGATLIRCKVTGNVAGRYVNGAGLCVKGTPFLAENCLFAKNSGSIQTAGGGVYANVAATFVNCTIAGNQAATGGGVHATAAAKFVNCIVIGNQVLADTTAGAPEWNGASAIYRYCLSTKAMTAGSSDCRVAATANFTDEANGDYTLTVSSDARDHGLDHPAEGDSEIDLAHENRYSGKAIDIGCYELQMASFLCDFTWTAERSVAGAPFSFRADVVTEEEGEILCRWSFDGGANWTDWSASREATTSFGSLGYHTVSLQAKVGDTEHEAVSHDVFVSPAEVYLADVAQHPDIVPAFPYASSETAATNVHDVMTAAGGGTVVHVAPGTYEITNCVWLTSPIEIVGDEGAETTVFVRRRAFPRGTAEMEQRCFRLSHPQAKLKGLTITGGDIHYEAGPDVNASYGAGVYIDAKGGTLDSCAVTNCINHYFAVGGGVAVGGGAAGLVTNCVIRDNIASYGSGGKVPKAAGIYVMGGATVVDTLIAGNHPDQKTDWCQCTGGGVYVADGGGTIIRCVITNNSSGCNFAAGVCLGNAAARLVNCLVVGNYQIKTSNTHACRGGGVMIGTGTAGAEGAAAVNCTIVGNTAGEMGGGVYGNTGSYQNCIIQDNALVSGDTSVEWGSDGPSFLPTFVACLCPEKLPEKILSKPLNYVGRIDFAEERPYDVPYQSAAHNKGVIAPYEQYLVDGADLYGRPRIVSRKVDIGCTECQIRPGLMLMVK